MPEITSFIIWKSIETKWLEICIITGTTTFVIAANSVPLEVEVENQRQDLGYARTIIPEGKSERYILVYLNDFLS